MNKTVRVFSILLGFFIGNSSHAAFFTFPELDTTQVTPIFQTLASGLTFRSLEGPSDLGAKWGVYVGVAANLTDASATSSIFNGLALSFIPTAEISFGIGLPAGFVIEAGILPTLSISGTQFNKYSAGLKWTLTRSFLKKFPLDMAAQVGFSSAGLNFSQTVSSLDVNVDYTATMVSANFLIGKKVSVMEPFIGVGVVNQSSGLSASGTGTIFGNSFPIGTQSVTDTSLTFWFQGGLVLDFYGFRITGEYDNLFGASSYSGKISLRF